MLSPDSAVYLSTCAGKACALLCASSSTAESSSVRRRGRHSLCRRGLGKKKEKIPGPKNKNPLLKGGRPPPLSFFLFSLWGVVFLTRQTHPSLGFYYLHA